MTGEDLKNNLEGLSKIDGITDILFDVIYWLVVIFVVLFIAYIFSVITCYYNKKKRGTLHADNDNFLGD